MLARFVSATSWSVFGSVLANGISLVTTILVARLLGKESFGHYIALQTTVVTAAAFSWFGVGYTATRYSAELQRRDPARLGRILGLSQLIVGVVGVAATLSVIVASGWIARSAFHAPEIAPALAIAAAAILFSSLDGLQKNILIGLSEMRAFAWSSIAGVALSAPLMVGLSYFHGLWGASFAIAAGALANCLVSWIWARSRLKKIGVRATLRGATQENHTLLNFALPSLLSGVMPAAGQWTVQSIVARAGDAGELALFGVAMQWFHIVNFLPATIARAFMPMLTDVVSDKDHGASRRLLLAGAAASVMAAVPVALAGALLSPRIMGLYGPQFVGGHAALALAMGVAVLHAGQYSVQQLIAARAHMWTGIAMNATMSAIFVIAASVLIPYGAVGAIGALAIAYFVQAVWAMSYAGAFVRSFAQEPNERL